MIMPSRIGNISHLATKLWGRATAVSMALTIQTPLLSMVRPSRCWITMPSWRQHAQPQTLRGAVLSLSSPLPLSPAESLLRNSPHPAQLRQQQRFRWTKAKKKRHARYLYRQELVRLGKPLQRPPNFFPKNTGVANSLSKEEREAERQRLDAQVAQALKERIQQQKKEGKIMLRHDFDEVPMSDRVRKLFALHNGNTKEVTMIQKKRSMELFQIREGDTGSSAVQVVALTNRIHQLQAHFSKHKQDKHSRRGMEALINRRRKVLNYLERKDFESYRLVVKALGLRRH